MTIVDRFYKLHGDQWCYVIMFIITMSIYYYLSYTDCKSINPNQCLDHCACFKCIHNFTEKCYNRDSVMHEVCDLFSETVQPNQNTCDANYTGVYFIACFDGMLIIISIILVCWVYQKYKIDPNIRASINRN